MTVVSLSELTSSVSNLSNQKTADNLIKVKDLRTSFSAFLNQSSKDVPAKKNEPVVQKDKESSNELFALKEKDSAVEKIQIMKPEDENQKIEIQKDELLKQTDQICEAIVQIISQTFGITPQEVMQVLETNQMAPLELLSPSNLAQVVGMIQNEQDFVGLLNSDGFQTVLSEIGEISNELLNDLGINKDQLQALCKSIVENQQNSPLLQTLKEPVLENQPENLDQNVVKITHEEATKIQLPVEKAITDEPKVVQTTEQVSTQVPVQQVMPQEDVKTVTLNEEKVEVNQLPVADEEPAQSQTGKESNTNKQPDLDLFTKSKEDKIMKTDLFNGQVQEVAPATVAKAVPVVPTTVDLVNLMDRISAFTKLSVGNQISTMEMQLNPENLGKVFVTVTSHHGEVSAHIAAQTEAAKEAIESQISQFRENLTQSGIKVQAVEVTIASHEFERNLEDSGQQFNQDQPEKRQNRRRMIDTESMQQDFMSGIMDEEDEIIANMMKDQGNTMDYQI